MPLFFIQFVSGVTWQLPKHHKLLKNCDPESTALVIRCSAGGAPRLRDNRPPTFICVACSFQSHDTSGCVCLYSMRTWENIGLPSLPKMVRFSSKHMIKKYVRMYVSKAIVVVEVLGIRMYLESYLVPWTLKYSPIREQQPWSRLCGAVGVCVCSSH